MKLNFIIHKLSSTVLLSILFLFGSHLVPAQDKSISDTISYILKNNEGHIQQCDALYALGEYYANIGQPEHALLVMNQSLAIAEKNDYP